MIFFFISLDFMDVVVLVISLITKLLLDLGKYKAKCCFNQFSLIILSISYKLLLDQMQFRVKCQMIIKYKTLHFKGLQLLNG